MSSDQQRLTATDRTNLVAYLDGELDQAESQSIAIRLTSSASARRELQGLERTWDLLDLLPRPRASPELTTRTLSQARQIEERGTRFLVSAGPSIRWVAGILIASALAMGAFGLGYVTTRWLWPDPLARLTRDLSIAENLDAYRAIGSLEFLRKLDAALTQDEP